MLVGYAGSAAKNTFAPNPSQKAALIEWLRAAGCEKIFADEPAPLELGGGLKALFDFLRPGDVLVVNQLAQLGETVDKVVLTLERVQEAGVSMAVGESRFIAGTVAGDAFRTTIRELAAVIKHPVITEEAADRRPRGRPSALSAENLVRARRLLEDGDMSVSDVARILGVSAATLYRHFPRRAGTPQT